MNQREIIHRSYFVRFAFETVDRKLCDLWKRVVGCFSMNKTIKRKYKGN